MEKTETKQTVMSYVESFLELFIYHQGKKDTLDYYSIMFKANVDSIKAHEGQPWHHPKLAKGLGDEHRASMINKEASVTYGRLAEIIKIADKKGQDDADDEMLACMFILGEDNGRFKEVKKSFSNAFTFGSDDYPKNITSALALLKNFKRSDQNNNNNNEEAEEGLGFMQAGSGSLSTANPKHANLECFICGEKGHIMHDCKSGTAEKRSEHMKTHKMNMMAKVAATREAAAKNGTQHSAIEAGDDNASEDTIDIGPYGLPTHKFLLKEGGYVGMNLGVIGGEDGNDADAANGDAPGITSVK